MLNCNNDDFVAMLNQFMSSSLMCSAREVLTCAAVLARMARRVALGVIDVSSYRVEGRRFQRPGLLSVAGLQDEMSHPCHPWSVLADARSMAAVLRDGSRSTQAAVDMTLQVAQNSSAGSRNHCLDRPGNVWQSKPEVHRADCPHTIDLAHAHGAHTHSAVASASVAAAAIDAVAFAFAAAEPAACASLR